MGCSEGAAEGSPGQTWAIFQPELRNLANKRAWYAANALSLWNGVGLEENRVGFDDGLPKFVWGSVHPGLTSWGILSRPCATGLVG